LGDRTPIEVGGAPDARKRSIAVRLAMRRCCWSGQHLLEATVSTSVRHQFGAPIGSFQALKHKLADVRIALEFARPLVHRAAYSMTTSLPLGAGKSRTSGLL
jgi:alkylation response protein AidB-like acyl-CoA dehydrogenase